MTRAGNPGAGFSFARGALSDSAVAYRHFLQGRALLSHAALSALSAATAWPSPPTPPPRWLPTSGGFNQHARKRTEARPAKHGTGRRPVGKPHGGKERPFATEAAVGAADPTR